MYLYLKKNGMQQAVEIDQLVMWRNVLLDTKSNELTRYA